MVKLRLISDTHFDDGINGDTSKKKGITHTPFGHYFSKVLNNEPDCITLIAGDLAASLTQTKAFLEGFFQDKTVFFIDGNHLVYNHEGKTIYELKDELRQEFPETHLFHHYLENSWMWIPGTDNNVAVIGSTFYTDYEYKTFTTKTYNAYNLRWANVLDAWGYGNTETKPIKRLTKQRLIRENLLLASERLNDFKWGHETEYTRLSPETYLKLNKLAKNKVQECYAEILKINPTAKIILMTHHCLSGKCIEDTYKDSISNASYVSSLEKWIDTMPNIRLVFSGHVHCRKDFKIGKNKTRYIINSCGYIPYNEPFKTLPKFNVNFIINTDDL